MKGRPTYTGQPSNQPTNLQTYMKVHNNFENIRILPGRMQILNLNLTNYPNVNNLSVDQFSLYANSSLEKSFAIQSVGNVLELVKTEKVNKGRYDKKKTSRFGLC